jgi:FkbM family methyltransferase
MIVVQVGANRGYDELTHLIKNINIDKLILIEPLSKFNDSLKKCYSDINNLFIENVAITDDINKTTDYFYLHEKMDDNMEQASLLKTHIDKVFDHSEYKIDKNHEDQIIKLPVNCTTINNIFNKHNLKNIDILFIDAEGFDDKIIKSIDFFNFNIKKIYYENMHIDFEDMSNFLKTNGYTVTNGTEMTKNNSVAIKNVLY